MFEIIITKKYLWFPVKNDGKKVFAQVFLDKETVYEFDIEVSLENADFYAVWNVENYIGKTFVFNGDFPAGWEKNIKNKDTPPEKKGRFPLIHFAPKTGWMNDPNGLIFANGIYHMYFQHNPFGIKWANMHWGHAFSKDLLHWEQADEALLPDENGTMFSGCAFLDEKGSAGFGKNTILYYYTAAPASGRSHGKKFKQMLALSSDGFNIKKLPMPVIEHIVADNRDPKVFYHEASNAYIMVLFLDGNDFAVFRSQNLLEWQLTQKLTLPPLWECPDLFPLTNENGEQRWIFWAADGYYFIGDFNGYEFIPKTEKLSAYATKLAYAAQTYSNTNGRIISQSWLRTKNHGTSYTGIMAIPVSISLKNTKNGERICLEPVEEMKFLRKNAKVLKSPENGTLTSLNENAAEIILNFYPCNEGISVLDIIGEKLSIDFSLGKVAFKGENFSFSNSDSLHLRIYIDYDALEIFTLDGSIYFPCEWDMKSLTGEISLESGNGMLESAEIYELG
jgi:levanase/fructan beta-fructosidase